MVSKLLSIAELALNISSKNATVAVGRNPCVHLMYRSFSKACNDRGPKISSGVVKRVNNLWKNGPPQRVDSLRPISDSKYRKRACFSTI
jgi:hypothetical protein